MTNDKMNEGDRAKAIARLISYFQTELDFELGQFDADFLLTFLTEEIGPFFYNQGLADARQLLHERLQTIDDALYDIEKPIK